MSSGHDHDGTAHNHNHDHNHDHGDPRISSPEGRELLKPFVDDLHEFLRDALAGVTGTIAEIGAGDGIIAERLRADGFDVVAIDAHQETAAAATAQGRNVEYADWLTWDGGGHAPFDALIFTRSLHHIAPLDQAAAQMLRLAPAGLLIADEFGHELVDERGAQFLMDTWALLAAAGLRDEEPQTATDPLSAWNQRMTVDHEVTSSASLLEAIGQVGEIDQVIHGRFMTQLCMYRVDPSHPHALAVRDQLIEIEQSRMDSGHMAKAGLRVVARLNEPS